MSPGSLPRPIYCDLNVGNFFKAQDHGCRFSLTQIMVFYSHTCSASHVSTTGPKRQQEPITLNKIRGLDCNMEYVRQFFQSLSLFLTGTRISLLRYHISPIFQLLFILLFQKLLSTSHPPHAEYQILTSPSVDLNSFETRTSFFQSLLLCHLSFRH